MTGKYRIKFWTNLFYWFCFLLLALLGFYMPVSLFVSANVHPDMDGIFFASCAGAFFFFMFSGNKLGKQTVVIRLRQDSFSVRKALRASKAYHYDQIIFHSQRKRKAEKKSWLEFYVYLENGDWFIIQSDEFSEYNVLKELFEQHGEHKYVPLPGFYADSLTRWAGRWLSLICVASIIFGYAAYDEVAQLPAQLTQIEGTVTSVKKNYSKSTFRGIEIRINQYPTFNFYADENDYTSSIRSLDEYLYPGRTAFFLIRHSENEKKLLLNRRLTFGDKYVEFDKINVFGVDEKKAEKIVYEDSNTSPNLRALLFGILLLASLRTWSD